MGCCCGSNEKMRVIDDPNNLEGYSRKYKMNYFENGSENPYSEGYFGVMVKWGGNEYWETEVTRWETDYDNPFGEQDMIIVWERRFGSTDSCTKGVKTIYNKWEEVSMGGREKQTYIHVHDTDPYQQPILINLNDEIGFLLGKKTKF